MGADVVLKLYPKDSNAIQAFMDASFSYSIHAKAIYVKIKNIQIQQSQNSMPNIALERSSGFEKLKDLNNNNFLIGLRSKQGVKIIP